MLRKTKLPQIAKHLLLVLSIFWIMGCISCKKNKGGNEKEFAPRQNKSATSNKNQAAATSDKPKHHKEKNHPKSRFDYTSYAKALKYVDDNGMVNYKALKKNRKDLDSFVKSLASQSKKEYKSWSLKEQLAFWINAYNGLTLKLIINHYPIQSSFFKSLAYPKNSIRQISGAWDSITHDVMGEKLTLDTIEHKILRKYFHEPRIHMALVCAAMGCPPLRNEPYLPSKLDSQLDDQTKKFLSNNKKFKIDRKEKIVYLSAIFSWFGKDFVEKYGTKTKFKDHSEPERAVLNFISSYLSKDDKEFLEKEKYSISYFKYDWSLNEQK